MITFTQQKVEVIKINSNLGHDKIKNRKRKFLTLTFFTLLTVLIMEIFLWRFPYYQQKRS